jgi:hypothetical protein
MKISGPWRSKKLVPGIGPESNDARKTRLNVSKLNGADKPGKVCAERPQKRVGVRLLANADDQKDRRACEWGDHILRKYDLV